MNCFFFQAQGAKWQKWGKATKAGPRRYEREKLSREASIEVKSDWEVIEQIEFSQLSKLKTTQIPQAKDLVRAGSVEYYDKDYDRVTVKNKKPLQRIEKTLFNVTTTDDPIIKKLSLDEGVGANIFATDAILAALMTCPRSSYSWDVVVRRVGARMLFFDKRYNSLFDYLTVNETASEPPRDDDPNPINTPLKLSNEATYVNKNFPQQVLSKVN